jgi:opacity protein-like surface antigen
MKRIGLILMFLLFSQTAFAAQNTGFYFGISGGYVIPQSMTMSESYYGDTDTTLENGGFVGVKSGWLTPFTRRIMALEMEYNYIFGTDFDKSKVVDLAGGGPSTLDGTIRVHAFLFNIKARFGVKITILTIEQVLSV